ncbi:DUF1800 domain-containing protein [Aphanothece hegewaldii CCALA 016]|uniref:DUF1800 domain-containing protein n=1 Tax=Aphanothece hegewaldii CCALA 016 TaxID=2107694 RepID=A0A2T1M0X4_9CHRO|nr:DUF1800 domain-containing protein [Aphanothece hegewaldii]PSF38314.1 DUF1800 domain-containing protein [Aphanothece hegewaldii CCALA 016]
MFCLKSPRETAKNTKSKIWALSLVLWLGWLSPVFAATPADPKVLHLLNRLSFGARPEEVNRVEKIGVDRYIQEQLSPNKLSEPRKLTDQLAKLETLQLTPDQLAQQYNLGRNQGRQKPSPEAMKVARQKTQQILQQAQQARLLRAINSPRQLQEVMVDFWYNHFNVYSGKRIVRVWVGSYEEQAIRPYVLGNFRDLVTATARHPAMLFYLDNWRNTAPESPGAKGQFNGLNENYARELMELHTLGVNGGYTQQDVTTLAKILTGWGFRRIEPQGPNNYNYTFYFDGKRHDFSDKTFFGQVIKGTGEAEGKQAIDILVRSPATARHISYKLAQYFVADEPSSALVNRLSQKFLATDGDIRAVLETLFDSPEFWDTQTYNSKFKTPYQFLISSVRATGAQVSNTRPIAGMLEQLGMPLYGCLTPDGYKNTQQAWLSPDAMTRRISLATAIANGSIPLTQDTKPAIQSYKPVDANQLMITLGNRFSPTTQQAITKSPEQLRAALILGSPEFMFR